MKSLLQNLVRVSLAAGLSLFAVLEADAQDSVGIVRISKPSTASMQRQQVMPASFGHHGRYAVADSANGSCPVQEANSCPPDYTCPHGNRCHFGLGCPFCHGGCGAPCFTWPYNTSQDMVNYFRCKFGYFIPTGGGGYGVPHAGIYSRVYPQDPHYFDQRDGQAWGAQGYGMPMAVPLAPTVGHAYNYSWGTPSSRLTPISRPAY